MFPIHIQKIISTYQILGIIPLDKFLHFIVGMIVTLALKYTKFSFKTTFIIIFGLCVLKEIIDYGTLQSSILESIADTVVTFIYPLMLLGIEWLKRKYNETEEMK